MFRDSIRRRYSRFWGPDPERDVDDEIAFHLAMRVEEFQRAGMAPAEAEALARERFGSLGSVREECRELARRRHTRQERWLRLDFLVQDVRYALRSMAANPGFSAVVALTMALGIGANSAVFSVAYGVLLRPLPYPEAGALVRIWSRNSSRGLEFFSVSPADYEAWRGQRGVFSRMGAFERQREATLLRGDRPEAVQVSAVTPEIFSLLGVGALGGRVLLADDARPDAPPAAAIDHALWTTRLGSDSAVIGGTLHLDDLPYTVVGVMPPRFAVPGTPAQVWIPLSLPDAAAERGNRYLRVLGRLAPGVTLEGARGEMELIAGRVAREFPATNAGWSVNLLPVTDVVVGPEFRRTVLALVGAVAFVLLIACANSASLLLARASTRRREIALRAALGATRGRITTQLLTESTVLGLIAGAAGLGLAYAGLRVLRTVGAEMIPRLDEVRLDPPVLGFTVLVALGGGLLFGVLPALGSSRSNIGEVLKEAGRGQGRTVAGGRTLAALVVAEVSLSLILLVGAGLLLRSYARLQAVDTGFQAAGVVVVPLRLPESDYPDSVAVREFYRELLGQVRSLPGISDAGAVSSPPFGGPNSGNVFLPEGQVVAARAQMPDADYRLITPAYLRTLGIRLLRGRDLDQRDAPTAALVSETMARRHWPGEDPIGRRFRVSDTAGTLHTIVGVVADARYQSLESEIRPMMYFPAQADPPRAMSLVVRGTGDLAPALRRTIASLDSRLPPPTVSRMTDLVGEGLGTARFALVVFAVFAAAALILAAVGIYGLMSYLVRQRTHELGVRIALGASPGALVTWVIARALGLTLAGVALGLAGAWGLTRLIASLLYGVSATDPATFGAIAILLTAVSLAASAIPARRATRADPLLALRGEG